MVKNLIEILINSAEKAANIARKIREDENLLQLLIQKKSNDEANPRFVDDFKTLADVLIQESIKNDVGNCFPEMSANIKGEESSQFTNSLGESVSVKICGNALETADILEKVLNGNKIAAQILADQVHQNIDYASNFNGIPDNLDLDYSELGIWIDPIDATSEYIAGESKLSNSTEILSAGLKCVTVLIGVYDKSGTPIIGVVNQPFNEQFDNSYKSKLYWGIAFGDITANNLDLSNVNSLSGTTMIGVFSSSENTEILELMKNLKHEIIFTAGAGHKALTVICSKADFYLLSKSSTFLWDTCGPQAILRSLGGDMFDLKKSLKEKKLIPIKYGSEKCNKGGIIAIRNIQIGEKLLGALKSNEDI